MKKPNVPDPLWIYADGQRRWSTRAEAEADLDEMGGFLSYQSDPDGGPGYWLVGDAVPDYAEQVQPERAAWNGATA